MDGERNNAVNSGAHIKVTTAAMTDYELAKNGYDEEIDFVDFYARVKPWLIPAVFIGILIATAVFFYAKTLEKTYSATAKFVIIEANKSTFPSLGVVSSFISPTAVGSEAALVSDKVMSRDFIIGLFSSTEIDKDPFFNNKNDSSFFLSTIFHKNPPTSDVIIERIIEKYRTVVTIDKSGDDGIIDLHVDHSDPIAAAMLANAIMETHIDNIEEKRFKTNQRRVHLMRDRLLLAQEDLNYALQAARIYAVENSVRSKEELEASSLNLARFRRELVRLEAILDGIDYIEKQREATPSGSFNLEVFFEKHPLAFTPLQNDLKWPNNRGIISIPTTVQLETIKEPLLDELGQLRRTLSVIENEASENSEAAGRLAELEREIEVHKSIYTALVGQFEAQDLSAELQSGSVEIIQKATPPLNSSGPKVFIITLLVFLLTGFLVILLGFINSWRNGKIYTNKKISEFLQQPIVASDIGQSVGTHAVTLSKLSQKLQKRNNPELLDLALYLRDQETKSLCVWGIPNIPVARNLAILLASSLTQKDKRIAVVDLARRDTNVKEFLFQENGTFMGLENDAGVFSFRWVKSQSADARSLDTALSQIEADFDKVIIICASLKWGGLRNKVAINRSSHIILLARRGATTKRDVVIVKRILSNMGEKKTTLTLV